jgi:hypothetical protein
MRLVHHHPAIVAPGQPQHLLERSDVAVHGEDAVGDNQGATTLRLAQAPGQVLDVGVAVDEGLGAREAATVDDAGVVELIGEHHLAAPGQRRDRARVRQVARAEQERGVVALEGGQAFFQPAVELHVARDQAGGTRAHSPAHRGLGGRLAHARMVGEPEVVVRAEQKHRAAVQQHARALGAADQSHSPVQTSPAQLLEALGEVGH